MNSIGDILTGRQAEEPTEIRIIKKFVHDKYAITPQVSILGDQIIIGVSSASLAGALRPHLLHIQEICHTTKRLTIRIK